MSKRTGKRKYTVEDAVDFVTSRPSDISDAESEEESVLSYDSAEEALLAERLDPILDAQSDDPDDPEWEPLAEFYVEEDDDDEHSSDPAPDPEPDPAPDPAPEPEPEPRPSKRPHLEKNTGRGRGRARARGRSRSRGRGRGRGPTSPSRVEGRWYGTEKPDITPTQPPFCPKRTVGSQLISTADYTVLELFQHFLSCTVLLTLVTNTNIHGRKTYRTWEDITLKDIFSVLSIVIYMGFTKVPQMTDYWRQGRLYSLPFPKSVITGKKFLAIIQALHISNPADDTANERARGTPAFDRLGKIKPLYIQIRDACRQNYQPGQHIAIDERMVASKARTIFKQYLKSKPTRWGFKLFVLADSETGYTWDFFVYEGKNMEASQKGLSYDSVVHLLNTNLLGTGYKLYVDNFYTSPALFQDLRKRNISACGTIRTNRKGFPKTTVNALDSKSTRGSIRWIREDPLLFVQWKDTRDVFMCSTMHTAHGRETVQRKVKDDAGRWTKKDVPIPPAIKDYNKHMGGVDLSDALIGYYEVLHKTKKWYKTFFYHFVDISIVNSYILYKAQCKRKGSTPMSQKAFRETLVLELADAGSTKAAAQPEHERSRHHRLVHISSSGDKSQGRLKCRKCHSKTPVKCSTCDMPLCFMPLRDCYNEWHVEKNL